eukprot:1188394-Prorocentrum_minimum.AAC.3
MTKLVVTTKDTRMMRRRGIGASRSLAVLCAALVLSSSSSSLWVQAEGGRHHGQQHHVVELPNVHHHELPGLDVEYSQPTLRLVDGSFVGPTVTPPTFEIKHTPGGMHTPLEVEMPEVSVGHGDHHGHHGARTRHPRRPLSTPELLSVGSTATHRPPAREGNNLPPLLRLVRCGARVRPPCRKRSGGEEERGTRHDRVTHMITGPAK